MTSGRRDRRVVRTRQLLQDALVALILERGYADLTVQDVLDRADVGRATFYSHFRGKDALLLSLFDSLQDSLRAQMMELTPADIARFGEGVGMVEPLFAHAARHRRLYQALLGSRDGGLLLGHLHSLLAAPLRAHLEGVRAQGGISPQAPIELVVAAIVSARLGALVWWLEAGLPYSPAEMDRLVEQLTTGGAALVLAPGPEGREHRAQRIRSQFSLQPAAAHPSPPSPPHRSCS